MIPKIIHYCWFGPNPIPKREMLFLSIWKKKLPDYKFMFWNEKTFNVNDYNYTKEAYDTKNYVFITDLLRSYVLVKYGGFYLDMDVEVIKSLDPFLENRVILGTEDWKGGMLTALMGAEPNHPFFVEMLNEYADRRFIFPDGSFNKEVSNQVYKRVLKGYGFIDKDENQFLREGIKVVTSDYFSVYNLIDDKLYKTDNTVTIHWHSLLWVSRFTKIIKMIRIKILVPLLGKDRYRKISESLKQTK